MLQLQYNILPAENYLTLSTVLHTYLTPALADTDMCQSREQEVNSFSSANKLHMSKVYN